MSYMVENTPEELADLNGATILSARIVTIAELKERALSEDDPWFADFIDQDVLELRVRFRDGLVVNGSCFGEYQVWQDEEGNGPGYFALTGTGSTQETE